MRDSIIKFFVAVMFCFAFTCNAADKKKPVAQTPEALRIEALGQINAFSERMEKLDPGFKSKETRILAAVPIIAKNYSPDQWLERVQFLYAALSEIDAKAQSIDPEAILSKYYPDELQRAPTNVLSMPSSTRSNIVSERADELEKQLNANIISNLEHDARMLAVARVYFPNSARFVGARQYKFDLAIRLAKGEIDKERYDALWAMKRQEIRGEIARDDAQIQQQQQLANDQAAAQQSAMDAQRRSMMLSNAARSVQNAVNSQRVPVTCTAVANIMTCR